MPDMGWQNYINAQEDAEAFAKIPALEAALRERNEGRNLECWPLCSFGWKDADLDPEGCTGIARIVPELTTADKVTVEVGGHKRIGLDEEADESEADVAQEIVWGTGYPGDWEGDSWCLHTSENVSVDWKINEETGDWDVEATADAIIEAARKAIAPFERDMKELDEAMDAWYKELSREDVEEEV